MDAICFIAIRVEFYKGATGSLDLQNLVFSHALQTGSTGRVATFGWRADVDRNKFNPLIGILARSGIEQRRRDALEIHLPRDQ